MPSDAKPNLTPKLRFPEFRARPGWESRSFEEVGEFVGERVPVSELDRKNYVSTENFLPDFGGFPLEALKTHKRGLMQQLFPSPTEAAA